MGVSDSGRRKKDGRARICVDYRRLNDVTKKTLILDRESTIYLTFYVLQVAIIKYLSKWETHKDWISYTMGPQQVNCNVIWIVERARYFSAANGVSLLRTHRRRLFDIYR